MSETSTGSSPEYVKTEWGWNYKHKRPATKEEMFHKPWEVCYCSDCATQGSYGHFYCGRKKAYGYITNMERRYWELREALSKQEMADEEIRRRRINRDRNREAVQRYAGHGE